MTFRTPVEEIGFALHEVVGLADMAELPAFADLDLAMVPDLLSEVARLSDEVIAPTYRAGDVERVRIDADGVHVPPSFHAAYERYVAGGWSGVQHEARFGGGGLPLTVALALREPVVAGNIAFSMAPALAAGAARVIAAHGSDEQRQRLLPQLASGAWLAAMNLTEPEAGSDLSATACVALPADDGTYRLRGQKIYITYGDHDLTEQIVHLVLARIPGSAPGTRGLSLFLVPKHLIGRDGSLAGRNDVEAISIEHKLGLHGSPTCVMEFGGRTGGAVAEIVGEPGSGVRQMFTMMNEERLSVGLQGVALSERAFQSAFAYATTRLQGRAAGAAPGTRSPIIDHPDVRRMLLTIRATTEAMRLICYSTARAIDRSEHHPDPGVRETEGRYADLLTPVAKAWCSYRACDMASIAIQVHGGMGYVEETGVAQLLRDARCTPIYEGTNGIQAIDLALRKVRVDGGGPVTAYLDALERRFEAAPADLAPLVTKAREAIALLRGSVAWTLEEGREDGDVLAGASDLLEVFGSVLGAAWLTVSAVVAARALERGGSPYGESFLRERIALAEFAVEVLLPRVRGHDASLRSGAGVLFADALLRYGSDDRS